MFIAKQSKNKELKNNILALASKAKAAKSLDSNVINATIGMLKNEDGNLYEFQSVVSATKVLSEEDKFAYANSSGRPTYTKAVLYSIFGKYLYFSLFTI